MHYVGRFTKSPNKQYVEGETCFVDMIDIGGFNIELVNIVLNCIGYEDNDDLHKMMYVYVEKVEKTESSSDEEGEGDSESEDGNDFVDEEHLVDEVEVNMKYDTEFIDPIQPNVNVTEDDLEVLDFDSLESDHDDENARSRGLRMLRKKHKSSGISNNFYVGKEFPNRDLAKERIRAYAVQYSLLRDYANELQRCNPDTTVKIDVYGKKDPKKTIRMFRRIYVCLGALKRGFKEGGRKLLGLDGAFMGGQYPEQLLRVVGMDANNGIYPVANFNFTFITDRQKGLLPTIAKLFPSAEHRFCVRHINENMNLTWKGGDYKEMLWRCATSTTIVKFEKHMDVMVSAF
ncbi:hypothetical protein Tco_1227535 [Tanacetum coccineum]